MMKNFASFSCLFILVLVNTGCTRSCIEANYSFAVNAQIICKYDSIPIGDTIFLISSFPVQLTDINSNKLINYDNSTTIGSDLGIIKLVSNFPGQEDAVDNFNFFNVIGSIYNFKDIPRPNKFQQLNYAEDNGFYKLKIGLIPKQKGTFYLGIGDGLSTGRRNSRFCEVANFNVTINNSNQHFNYFSVWDSSATLGDNEKKRAYFLKVY